MSKKQKSRSGLFLAGLHCATVSFLVAGIVVLSGASEEVLFAARSGQGSNVLPQATRAARLEAGNLHSVAFLIEHPGADAAKALAIGSLLIFTGFFFHVLVVFHTDRPVRVVAGARKTPNIRIQEIYWMEIIPRRGLRR